MDERPNPFSLYDFLGYFVPGALFVYGIEFSRTKAPIVDKLLQSIPDIHWLERQSAVEIFVPFILLSYLFGHMLSVISSYTIERFALWRYGYPSKYLLGFPRPNYWRLSNKEVHKFHRCCLRIFVPIAMLPVVILDLILGRELYAKTLDNLLITIISDKIAQLVNNEGGYAVLNNVSEHKSSEQDWFRFTYHYALEKAPSHRSKMQNYVALYGFCRTATLLGLIFFWIIALSQITMHHSVGRFCIGLDSNIYTAFWMTATALASYAMFVGFNKFYRRFTLEGFMAFAVVYPTNKSSGGNPASST